MGNHVYLPPLNINAKKSYFNLCIILIFFSSSFPIPIFSSDFFVSTKKSTIFAASIKANDHYGTERIQIAEIILHHQGGCRDVWSEREYVTLLGNRIPVSQAQDLRTGQSAAVPGEGH